MARPSKEYEVFSGRIRKDSAEMLTQMNEEIGLPKTVIVEKAIEMYFKYYKKTGKVNVDVKEV